jgi:hypothetical protein
MNNYWYNPWCPTYDVLPTKKKTGTHEKTSRYGGLLRYFRGFQQGPAFWTAMAG